MLSALIYLVIVFLITHAIGETVLQNSNKWFKVKPIQSLGIGLTNIIGLAFLAPFIALIHFFYPINYSSSRLFIIAFLVIVYTRNSQTLKTLLQTLKNNKLIIIGLIIAAAVSILLRPGTGDIGDYHLQAILWAEKYPNIIGLGNFNRPLANNNWWFNLQAFFGLNSISLYGLNAVFFMSVMLFFLLESSRHKFLNAFKYILLLFTAISTKTAFVGSVTPDYIVTNLIFVCAYLYVKFWFEREAISMYVILILSLFAITVKLNAIVLFPLSILAFAVYYKQKIFKYKIWLPIIGLCCLFIIPWLIGNVIISGWLVYPINFVDLFTVDWKIPVDVLKYERFSIMQWGKIQNQEIYITAQLGLTEWFPVWFKHNDIFNKALIAIFPLAILCAIIFGNKTNKELRFALLYFGIIGTAFCFSNGPHIRYAYGYILVLVATGFATIYTKFISINLQKYLFAFVLLSLLPIALSLPKIDFKNYWFKLPNYAESTSVLTNLGDEKVYLTNISNNCWAQFPCSYYMVEGCELRGKDFTDGFRVKN